MWTGWARPFPSKLQLGALAAIDAALSKLGSPVWIAAALEAHALDQGHIATQQVLRSLREIPGILVRMRKFDQIESIAAQQLLAFNDCGESFLLKIENPSNWIASRMDFSGEVIHSEVGTAGQLRKNLGLLPILWSLDFDASRADSISRTNQHQNYVTEPFWSLRGDAALVVFSGLVVTILGVVTPLGFQAFTDKVLPFQASSSLLVVLVLLTLAIFASSVMEAAHEYLESVMSARLQRQLGAEMVRRLLHMPLSYFDIRPAGELTKLSSQVNTVAQFQVRQLLQSTVSVLSLLVVLPLLLIYSTSLTMMVLGMGMLMAATVALSLRVYQRRVGRAYLLDADFQSGLIELIKGIRTVKALAIEKHIEVTQVQRLENQLFGGFDVERLGHLLRAVVNFQSKMVAVFVLGIGAQAAFRGEFSVGQLIAFYMLSDRLVQPLVAMVMAVNGWQSYRLAKSKLNELLPPSWATIQSPMTDNLVQTVKVPLFEVCGDIEFDDVWFRYPGTDADVLKGVSFRVRQGEMTGIVGESGSGKSTVLSLLQGFYAPTSGCIKIGGINIVDIPSEVLRSKMSVVSQSSFLFNQSVFENVRLGKLNSSAQDVFQALKQANCSFVDAMPQRFASMLNEDGQNLSGGQRQRLAIARAFIRNAPIMLLDEATSALDRQTEEAIKSSVLQMCKGKTAVLIAHRLSTLSDCHQIIVMDSGKVVDQGLTEPVLSRINMQRTPDALQFS